jgi:1-acylglycerone phosphate reductase
MFLTLHSQTMPPSSKTCLITGCSEGGVGDALVVAFKNNGYHVFATARNTSKIPQSLHGDDNVSIIALEVTDSSSILAASEIVRNQTDGSLDVLINNAGAGMNMPALDTNFAEAKKLFDLNLFAALEMVQVFSPMLVKAGGCVVNNASVGGLRPLLFNGTLETIRMFFFYVCSNSEPATKCANRHLQCHEGVFDSDRRSIATGNGASRCPSAHGIVIFDSN